MVEWNEDEGRWFVGGRGVYAGSSMEMQGVVVVGYDDDGEPETEPGEWFEVVIESREGGRVLDAYAQVHGVRFCARSVAGFEGDEPFASYGLRWPGSS